MGDKETLKKEYQRAAGRAAEQDAAPDAYREGLEDIERMNYRILRGILLIVGAVVAGLAIAYSIWFLLS
jgi:hypothetical protein